jgi:hypothetical protein
MDRVSVARFYYQHVLKLRVLVPEYEVSYVCFIDLTDISQASKNSAWLCSYPRVQRRMDL